MSFTNYRYELVILIGLCYTYWINVSGILETGWVYEKKHQKGIIYGSFADIVAWLYLFGAGGFREVEKGV